MVTNICSLKLLHVSATIMNCEETDNSVFSEDQLFPLQNCHQFVSQWGCFTHIHEHDLKIFIYVCLQYICTLLQACSNMHVVCIFFACEQVNVNLCFGMSKRYGICIWYLCWGACECLGGESVGEGIYLFKWGHLQTCTHLYIDVTVPEREARKCVSVDDNIGTPVYPWAFGGCSHAGSLGTRLWTRASVWVTSVNVWGHMWVHESAHVERVCVGKGVWVSCTSPAEYKYKAAVWDGPCLTAWQYQAYLQKMKQNRQHESYFCLSAEAL